MLSQLKKNSINCAEKPAKLLANLERKGEETAKTGGHRGEMIEIIRTAQGINFAPGQTNYTPVSAVQATVFGVN